MKRHWYISTFILILTVIGICQNKFSSPNQEILVSFGDDQITIEHTQSAIASIKQQLYKFGIEDVHVSRGERGVLKIAYYSSIEVENIKQALSVDNNFDYTSSYSEKSSSDNPSKEYNLDIYELHKSTDNNGSAGKSVWIVKQDFDRFLNPNIITSSNDIDIFEASRLIKEAYKINSSIAIAIEETSHAIPEVRAGPSC